MADEKILLELDLDTGKVTRKLDGVSTKAKQAGKKSGRQFGSGFNEGFSKAKVAIAGAGLLILAKTIQRVSQTFREAVQDTRDFARGVAEINSILPANEKLTKRSELALIGFSSQFASNVTEQARSFYSIVSAGVKGTANQLSTLEVANKAAVAGLVDIDTSAKVLVSSVNSYSKSGLTATQASDALFAAVREGQTTFGELSNGLGIVAPLAASAGLKFTELTGSIAAITKAGIRTDQAVTGMKAVLTSILKPSAEATKEATRLGISLTQSSLKAKGFVKFIKEISSKTKNSAESIAKLFGNVRALTPILQLANAENKNFAEILKLTANSAGDTARAFKIISQNLDFKMKKRTQEIRNFGLVIAKTASETFKGVRGSIVPSIEAIQNGFIMFAKAITNFIIAPVELVFNILRVAFRFTVKILDDMLATVGDKAGKIAQLLGAAGINNELTRNLTTFAESTKEAADDAAVKLKEANDKIFEGSIFGGASAFTANLENNIALAKDALTNSGIVPPGSNGGDTDAAAPVKKEIFSVMALFGDLGAAFNATEAEIKNGMKNLAASAKFLGQGIKKGIGQGLGSAFGAMGKALASGENALDAFASAFLGTLGQMMVQQGTAFILQGLGFQVIPGMTASGSSLIATGAALATFGGLLSGISGGAKPAAGGANASGGGGGGLASTESTATEQLEEREAQQSVQLIVQGDILDSDSTGLRILDLLNNNFEKSGSVVTGANFA